LTGSAPKLLVLDQGVPRDAATRLRGLGYECTHVGEIGMGKAADDEILAWSLGKNAIVVTLDADFHTILAVTGARGPSVIRLRIQGLGAQAVVDSEGAQDNVSPAASRQFRLTAGRERVSHPRSTRVSTSPASSVACALYGQVDIQKKVARLIQFWQFDLDAEFHPFNRALLLADTTVRMRNSRIRDPKAAFSVRQRTQIRHVFFDISFQEIR
jgi:predicted nuclease of predicted toxin-antitoxin system